MMKTPTSLCLQTPEHGSSKTVINAVGSFCLFTPNIGSVPCSLSLDGSQKQMASPTYGIKMYSHIASFYQWSNKDGK